MSEPEVVRGWAAPGGSAAGWQPGVAPGVGAAPAPAQWRVGAVDAAFVQAAGRAVSGGTRVVAAVGGAAVLVGVAAAVSRLTTPTSVTIGVLGCLLLGVALAGRRQTRPRLEAAYPIGSVLGVAVAEDLWVVSATGFAMGRYWNVLRVREAHGLVMLTMRTGGMHLLPAALLGPEGLAELRRRVEAARPMA